MGLMARLSSLARADAHGVVDALEDKALVLRQQVREAAAELDRKRCRIDALAAEDKDLRTQGERIGERKAALEADVELALAGDQDELARYAIKKLLPLRHGATEIERRRAALAEERAGLEQQLAEQEAEFELLESRVKGFLARQGEEAGGGRAFTDLAVTDQDVELELLRRQAAREGGA